VFGGTTLLAWLTERLSGRRGLARAWGWGYAVHLLGDVSARFAFFYPLSRRGYREGARMKEILRGQRRWPWRITIAEALLVGAALVSEAYAARKGSA
jgi:hypothetical protein